MPEQIAAGDGAPPAPQSQGVTEAPAQNAEAEGNVSILDYARRKLREKDAKPAEGKAKGEPQKQPSPPKAPPEAKTVLSHSAESASAPESPAPQAEEETPAATQEDTEVAESQEATETDGEEELPSDAPEWMQKRIARFTRQKHELQRQLEEATASQNAIRAELDQLKVGEHQSPTDPQPPLVVEKDDPAGHFTTEKQLETAMLQAREMRRWCMRNPEGGVFQVPDGKGGISEREFTAQQVTALREAAEDDIEQHLPRRREHIRAERAFTSEALRAHPWLADKKSPRLALVNQLLADYPQIKLRPDWAQAAAVFVRGLEVVQHEQEEATKAVTTPRPKPGPPPPKIPGPSPTAPRKQGPATVANAELKAAEDDWEKNPGQRTFARLQRAKRQQRQQ